MKFASEQDRKVVLDVRQVDVTVEGYDGDELQIHGSGHYEAPSALAHGLRPIYAGGADNTRLGMSVTAAGSNTLRISSAPGADGHYTVRVPRRTDVSFAQNGWAGSDDLTLRNLAGRIEVSLNSGDLRLLNVSGGGGGQHHQRRRESDLQWGARPALRHLDGEWRRGREPAAHLQGEPLHALDFGRNLHRLRPQPG